MTALSVNVNKLALLRNSRGHNHPNLLHFAERFLALGVHGITVHPRPDERHVRRQDVYELSGLLAAYPNVEFNVEGYPSPQFMQLISDTRPDQCTLVPDAESQLTSDHGWDCREYKTFLSSICSELRVLGVRAAVFMDPDPAMAEHAAAVGAQRVELYTEAYAQAFEGDYRGEVLQQYAATARHARACGLGVNAGHDLNLRNLPAFLQIAGIEEVSIGHALTIECIEQGLETVIAQYLAICAKGA